MGRPILASTIDHALITVDSQGLWPSFPVCIDSPTATQDLGLKVCIDSPTATQDLGSPSVGLKGPHCHTSIMDPEQGGSRGQWPHLKTSF